MNIRAWFRSGDPWIWLNAGAVAMSFVMVAGLLFLIAARGLGHFWPRDVVSVEYLQPDGQVVTLLGEIVDSETVRERLFDAAGYDEMDVDDRLITRDLLRTGNRDVTGNDFRWIARPAVKSTSRPADALVLERREWGNFYGYLEAVLEDGAVVAEGEAARAAMRDRLARALDLHHQVEELEGGELRSINYRLEQLRLEERRMMLEGDVSVEAVADIEAERAELNARYETLEAQLASLYERASRDAVRLSTSGGRDVTVSLDNVVRAYRPNRMDVFDKLGFYAAKAWEFVSDQPREANTEGGIFPAIFGTVLMVLLMTIFVTPFGVIAAVYLREYARQGVLVRTIRVAVNNLAGVPSIVYGVFGLGFFIYALGGTIDQLFYPEALPAPTFGTGGLFWASLTMALLTLPVVIVSTEEGLARIPREIREGSLALGATRAETLWRTVLPMASPAMMTGVILAVARAAGEVAPLMLVGVVKLAPTLPLDGNFPYLHLERKFMHLGFHIYDVGFQSPNVEAARPLVYATSLLLVVIIIVLNLVAISIRNRLREKYRALET
jgi:phosphate transport system permease protein